MSETSGRGGRGHFRFSGPGVRALLALALALVAGRAGAVDFSPWSSKARITFQGYARTEALTNFPALVAVGTNIAGFAYAQFADAANGGDLRFSASDGTTELPYEIDRWNATGLSHVWVKVPALASSNDFIWAYWGNPAATNPPAYTTNGAVWSQNFQGVWHMTQTSARDSATNTLHGTGSGVAATNGLIGGALYFNSNDNTRVDLPFFNPPEPLTVSAWVKAPQGTGSRTILSWMRFDAKAIEFRVDGDWPGNILYGQWNGSNWSPIRSMDRVDRDLWWHVAATKHGSAVSVWTNGQFAGSGTLGEPVSFLLDSVSIGRRPYNEKNPFAGTIDELRVDSVVRSTNWIWACWRNQGADPAFNLYGARIGSAVTNPPVVVNSVATGITAQAAWMNGTLVSTGNAPTTVSLLWGDEDPGATLAGWDHVQHLGPQLEGSLGFQATGLTPDHVYYYRYAATNGGGLSIASPAISFSTLPATNQFAHRMKIVFTGYTRPETLTDFPALVVFRPELPGFAYSQLVSPTGGDLRFLDASEQFLLSHEIESWNTNEASQVWVRVPELAGTNTYIWAYWGNSAATSPPSYTTNGMTWNSGFRGVWHMVEQFVPRDSTAYAWNGTGSGVTPTAGKVNGALQFTRTSGTHVHLPNAVQPAPLTVSAWIKAPAATTDRDIVGWGRTDLFQVGEFRIGNAGYWPVEGALTYGEWNGVQWGFLSSPARVDDNTWWHVAAVKVGINVTLYTNGYQAASANLNGQPPQPVLNNVQIGRNQGTGDASAFDGMIDEVRIEQVARSADWIWATCQNMDTNAAFQVYGLVEGAVPPPSGFTLYVY